MSLSTLSAGLCMGVKSYISISLGITMIPPGCCPVVLFTPSKPLDNHVRTAWVGFFPLSSMYLRTYPLAVFSAIPEMVPALKT